MKDDALLLLESSEDGGANAHVVVGAKMAASAADRRESLAMVDPLVLSRVFWRHLSQDKKNVRLWDIREEKRFNFKLDGVQIH